MRRTSAVAALVVSLSFAATLSLAQSPSTPGEPRVPGAATPSSEAFNTAATTVRAHDDVDARACLEFLTNAGVIRCAEKYRHAGERPAH